MQLWALHTSVTNCNNIVLDLHHILEVTMALFFGFILFGKKDHVSRFRVVSCVNPTQSRLIEIDGNH